MTPALSFLQISVPGTLGTAILTGLMKHVEYEITILAYYRDGTRSDPVSLRYTPCRWSITYIQMVLGQEQDRGDSGLLDLYILSGYHILRLKSSRLPESLRLWAGPLYLSPQGEQILGWLSPNSPAG